MGSMHLLARILLPLLCINFGTLKSEEQSLKNGRHFEEGGMFQGVSNNAHVINAQGPDGRSIIKREVEHRRSRVKRSYSAVSAYSAQEKQAILDAHNFYRSREQAANMNKLIWNDWLASRAQDWAENCVWEHRSGSDPSGSPFSPVGENLYYNTVVTAANKSTQVWVEFEINDFDYDTNTCTGAMCGHYTQAVWGNSEEIGCGIHLCSPLGNTNHNAYYSVCNYGPAGNWANTLPFIKGVPCTECKSGKYYCKDHLCTSCSGDSGCTCRAYCSNCGTVNTGDCTCNCVGTYEGTHCQTYNGPKCDGDNANCGTAWPYNPICTKSQYDQIANNKCATMCGKCDGITEPPCGNHTHADLDAIIGSGTTSGSVSVTSDPGTTSASVDDSLTSTSSDTSLDSDTSPVTSPVASPVTSPVSSPATSSSSESSTSTTSTSVSTTSTTNAAVSSTATTTSTTTTSSIGGACAGTTCANGGTATPSGAECSCKCADGWSGTTCDESSEELNSGVDVTVASSAGQWNVVWTTVKVVVNDTVNKLCNSYLYYESCCPQVTSSPSTFEPPLPYIDQSDITLGTGFPKMEGNSIRFVFYVEVPPSNDLCSAVARRKRSVIKMDQTTLFEAVSAAQQDLTTALVSCCNATIVSFERGSSSGSAPNGPRTTLLLILPVPILALVMIFFTRRA